MSAILRGGASGTDADVHTASQALRTILFDAKGESLVLDHPARSIYDIRVRQSAASAVGPIPGAIHNPNATTRVIVKRTSLKAFFDGTAAATLAKYEWVKWTGVTAFTGGVAITPIRKRTSLATIVAVARLLDTGLTLTGNVVQGVYSATVQGRVTQTTTVFSQTAETYQWDAFEGKEIELAQNEAFGLRLVNAAVIGDNVVG